MLYNAKVSTVVNGDYVFVEVKDEDYLICEQISHNLWCNKKKGCYGSGLLNTTHDPRITERTGLLGEMAVSAISHLPLDITYKELGMPYDFIYKNFTVDVKTTKSNLNKGLVIYRYEKKNALDADRYNNALCDIYIFTIIVNEDIENKKAYVKVIGWIDGEGLRTFSTIAPAIKTSRPLNCCHLNYEISYNNLYDIRILMGDVKCQSN